MEPNIQAVYLPVSYEPSSGLVELTSLQEGFKLMGVREDDVTTLPLPESTVYMSRSLQRHSKKSARSKKSVQVNKGATMVVQSAGLAGLNIWGPALVVKGLNRLTAMRS